MQLRNRFIIPPTENHLMHLWFYEEKSVQAATQENVSGTFTTLPKKSTVGLLNPLLTGHARSGGR